jgi:hypothetical protein
LGEKGCQKVDQKRKAIWNHQKTQVRNRYLRQKVPVQKSKSQRNKQINQKQTKPTKEKKK